MAINEAQAVQIENESLALKERSDRITAQINNYVATVNADPNPSSQYVTDGKALEAEAVDTLSAVNNFYNSPQVLDGRSDLDYQQRVNESLDAIRDARNQTSSALTDVRSTLATVGTAEPALEDATQSVGQIIGEDAVNRTENATVQNPETETDQGQQAIETTSNADETTTRQVGAFQDDEINAFSEDSGRTPPRTPVSTTGADNTKINSAYLKEIKPRPNILSRFATSTYNITLYMLSDLDYNQLMGFERNNDPATDPNAGIGEELKDLSRLTDIRTILSSGGLSVNNNDVGSIARASGFEDLDYFIDDLQIDTLMPQQVRGATNATQISFKITEPYGFTFLTKLKQASEEMASRTEDRRTSSSPADRSRSGKDWIRQHYLMVIRFYGQVDDPQDFEVETGGGADGNVVRVTAPVLSEKYIPFKFTNITTKAASGAVEYLCSAVPINHLEGMSQKRSTIKYQVEMSGQTLEELFNGGITQNGPNVKSGLMKSLNQHYQKLYPKTIGIPDQFEVNFSDQRLKDAKLIPPGTTKKSRTAMGDIIPGILVSTPDSVQKNILTFSANAGMQIQHFIDQVVRTSTYITGQQKKYIDPNTREVLERTPREVLEWYRVTSRTKSLGYDEKRKDYAYKVIYDVVPSAVSDVKTSFFPKKKFNGCQKRYKYWFTGENTEVLNYEVDFNALYYVSTSPDIEPDETDVDAIGELTSPGPSDQSIQGGADLASDPSARAASVLYSPTDYAILNMSILGDPDYIQQGDIFWRSLGADAVNPGFLADGSVDYDSGEFLIEVDYQTIEDYDEEKGIAPTKEVILKSPAERLRTTTSSGVEYKGLIYQVTQVTNNFSKGVFTQDIQGVLKQYLSDGDDVRKDPEKKPKKNIVGGPLQSNIANRYEPFPSSLKSNKIIDTDEDAG